ncbi:MAG TPA: glycosyltransferase family 4 protein [Pyrinomonadaceae bacterium]|nr:glycosyltransferase family 4 protein [Pyrinomonadaceae bacterium]
MKILYYNHTGQASGAEYLLLMVLARLDRNTFEPIVVCPHQGPLARMVEELKVPVEIVQGLEARFTSQGALLFRYLRSFIQVIRGLRKRVVTIKPDLIHANSIRAGLVASAATIGLRTKVVWHLHDLLPRHPISSLVRVCAFLAPRARMIAVSQAVATNFTGGISPLKKRIQVILNGIDLDKFQGSRSAGQEIRREFQLDESAVVFGIVGQLTPRKGQLELIRAFAKVLQRTPAATLLVVGSALFNRDEDYETLLKQTASDLGIVDRVLFTGSRKDVPAVMQAMDVLIVNSTIEPFGLVALEAMACGTPVLAAVSGGIPELIEHGKNGWLVPQGDESALTNAMLHLAPRPAACSLLAKEARLQMLSRFSAEEYLRQIQDFYHHTAGRAATVYEDRVVRPTETARVA